MAFKLQTILTKALNKFRLRYEYLLNGANTSDMQEEVLFENFAHLEHFKSEFEEVYKEAYKKVKETLKNKDIDIESFTYDVRNTNLQLYTVSAGKGFNIKVRPIEGSTKAPE